MSPIRRVPSTSILAVIGDFHAPKGAVVGVAREELLGELAEDAARNISNGKMVANARSGIRTFISLDFGNDRVGLASVFRLF